MYGLGWIYDAYRGRSCSLRSYKKTSRVRANSGGRNRSVDRATFNGPFLPHNRRSAEEVSFSEPFHQGAGMFSTMNALIIDDRWLWGRDTAEVSIQDSSSLLSVEWEK